MWRVFVFATFLVPSIAVAEVDSETTKGWAAFQKVCLEQVGNVKEALQTIPSLAREYTGNSKITDTGVRKAQFIPDSDDAWSYNDGTHWYMILTDYASCAVRVPGGYDGAHKAVLSKGYNHFGTIEGKWAKHEYYYSSNEEAPVLNLIHTVRNGEKRLAFIATNKKAYEIAVDRNPDDNIPLPE